MNETATRRWIGQSVERLENRALLKGTARFIDDVVPVAGIRHAAILRSPHGHAAIKRIDIAAAQSLPGVVGVLTGKDFAAICKPIANMITRDIDYYPCAVEKVRYFGEPVAIVVAESRYVAEDAVDLIEVEYEPLPAIVDIAGALDPEGTVLHERLNGNCVQERNFRYGDPEAAFAAAAHVVRYEANYPRVNSTPMETYGVIASFDAEAGDYAVWSNFQGPYALHPIICDSLRVQSNRFRLISAPFSGGSFGIKHGVFPYIILMSAASRLLGVPVKWIEDRLEHLAGSSAASGRRTAIEGAFDEAGMLTAIRLDQVENVGAYVRVPEPAGQYRMHAAINGPYLVRNVAVRNRVVVTNQVPSGLNRGFGGPQFFYPFERMMDVAARQIGIDPAELRMRNFIPGDAFPYKGPAGAVFDSGDYGLAVQAALDRIGYDKLRSEYEARRAEGRLCGIGIAVAIETSGSNMGYVSLAVPPEQRARSNAKSGAGATARVAMDASGSTTVFIDSVPQGQGHRTVVAQVVADELGLDPAAIRVVTELDTQDSIWSITSGNYANRFSTTVASAVALAGRKAAEKLRRVAADELGVEPDKVVLAGGQATSPGAQNKSIPIRRLAGRLHWDSTNLPDGVDGPIAESATFSPSDLGAPTPEDELNSSLTYSFQCDVVALEVNPKTGHISYDRYVTIHDAGTPLNPALMDGQIHGGFAHGFGAATTERLVYDRDGTLLTNTFQDYMCPTAPELPPLEIGHIVTPSPNTVHGSKGLGDGSSMVAPVAVANALSDALGIRDFDPPFTAPRLWSLIQGVDPDAGRDEAGPASAAAYPGKPLAGTGKVVLDAGPEQVWQVLLDVEGLAAIIPGYRSLEKTGPDRYRLSVDIRVAGIGGEYEGTIGFSRLQQPASLRLEGSAGGRLGAGRGHADVRLRPLPEGRTELEYAYVAGVTGKAVSFGHRMLNSVTNMLIGAFFEGLQGRFGAKRRGSRLKAAWRAASMLLGGLRR